MIRIGCSRWFVRTRRDRLRGGYVQYSVGLDPQARRYRIPIVNMDNFLVHDENPNQDNFLVEDVTPKQVVVSARADYSTAREELSIAATLAKEVASATVDECLKSKLVPNQGFTKAGIICLVHMSVVRCLQQGTSDADEQIDFIDLVPQIREIMEQRERDRREEQARLIIERMNAIENKNRSTKTSFDLLYSFLSEDELKEIRSTGNITVKNDLGTFVIPATGHGMVDCYVNGTYKTSYCVVFDDHTIPLGDEIMMKVALLKADPELFIKTANSFVQHRARPPVLA